MAATRLGRIAADFRATLPQAESRATIPFIRRKPILDLA